MGSRPHTKGDILPYLFESSLFCKILFSSRRPSLFSGVESGNIGVARRSPTSPDEKGRDGRREKKSKRAKTLLAVGPSEGGETGEAGESNGPIYKRRPSNLTRLTLGRRHSVSVVVTRPDPETPPPFLRRRRHGDEEKVPFL